jgi:hypothetical protein
VQALPRSNAGDDRAFVAENAQFEDRGDSVSLPGGSPAPDGMSGISTLAAAAQGRTPMLKSTPKTNRPIPRTAPSRTYNYRIQGEPRRRSMSW